jgi:hypothetical protein
MATLIRTLLPDTLIAQDRRGHAPFDYIRREHWGVWMDFLRENQCLIERRVALVDSFQHFFGEVWLSCPSIHFFFQTPHYIVIYYSKRLLNNKYWWSYFVTYVLATLSLPLPEAAEQLILQQESSTFIASLASGWLY